MKYLLLLVLLFDSANYREIDHCTSNNINSIRANLEVVGESENQFELKVDYSIRTIFGSYSSVKKRWLDKYLFSEQLLIDLRNGHTYVGKDFKIRYRTQDGDCDRVIMYDFPDYSDEINLKVCFGRPVLGIVEADTNGSYRDVDFKACVAMF